MSRATTSFIHYLKSTEHVVLRISWFSVVVAIPCLSIFGRQLLHLLTTHFSETTLAYLITTLLGILSILALCWLSKNQQKQNYGSLILVFTTLAVLFLLIIKFLPLAEERVHFLIFGLLGFLSYRLLPLGTSFLVVAVMSGGDELFQAWLPNRVGDWSDVLVNLVASAVGIGVVMFAGVKKAN